MGVTVNKTISYVIERTSYPEPFDTYGEAYDRAKSLSLYSVEKFGHDKCFVCDRAFRRDDAIFLASVAGWRNMFVCDKCAEVIYNYENDTASKCSE